MNSITNPPSAPQDAWHLLRTAGTVLAVHAHPDDESLSTGALLADLCGRGIRVVLLTATRGEEGEVVPGAVAADDERPLETIRAHEIDAATGALGISERHLLGTPPAAHAEPGLYRDSGMRWIREGLAGPSEHVGEDSFSRRPLDEAAMDLRSLIAHVDPDVLIGYDDEGTYGHPDHVRAHQVTAAAARGTGIPFVEVASDPDPADARFAFREHPGSLDAVELALTNYRTQLTVLGRIEEAPGAVEVRHVGGQLQQVPMRTGLRMYAG